MTIGLVGRKSGMTRVFTEDGASIPVTVVEIAPNRVTQVKELDNDGYRAIQVTAGSRKAAKVSKSEAGHFAKAGVEAGNGLWEFRLGADDEAPEVGAELTVERFPRGDKDRNQYQSRNNVEVKLCENCSVEQQLSDENQHAGQTHHVQQDTITDTSGFEQTP